MWKLDHKKCWVPKNWCFWIVVLERKPLESPLDSMEIQPVHPKVNQSWTFIGRMMLKLKLQYFGHLLQRAYSLEKKTWCWEILKARGEGDYRGWDGWMASLTQWTWVWVNSGRWWRTGKPWGVSESWTSFSEWTTITLKLHCQIHNPLWHIVNSIY